MVLDGVSLENRVVRDLAAIVGRPLGQKLEQALFFSAEIVALTRGERAEVLAALDRTPWDSSRLLRPVMPRWTPASLSLWLSQASGSRSGSLGRECVGGRENGGHGNTGVDFHPLAWMQGADTSPIRQKHGSERPGRGRYFSAARGSLGNWLQK